jgi:hypothetical protein
VGVGVPIVPVVGHVRAPVSLQADVAGKKGMIKTRSNLEGQSSIVAPAQVVLTLAQQRRDLTTCKLRSP